MTQPIAVLQPPCTGHDEARVRRQPPLVTALLDVVNIEPAFGVMKVIQVTTVESNPGPDGGIASLVLKGRIEGQTVGMAISYSYRDLQAALNHRPDHGSADCTISRLVTVDQIVKALIKKGYRIKNQFGDVGSGHVGLVLGAASQTPGEPYGLSIGIDWGSWLCGYPATEV